MKIFLTLFLTIILATEIESQVVIGKIVDENGQGLSSIGLQLYINPDIYSTTTLSDGSFIFDIVTGVEDEQLPTGYAVSNNFPNPFNPTTRIGITLPVKENVKIEVFNLLGQEVIKAIEQPLNAGTNFIDIELNGLANGIYNARVTIENKYTVVKKMMLVYGSQHLAISGGISNTELHKSNNTNLETNLDSLVATNLIIGRKTFLSLPSVTGDTLDLGNLTIERYCPGIPTVEYGSKTYNTIQIGSQCWLKENLDVGVMIQGSDTAKDNGVIEKYCYNNDPANCNTYGGLYQWNEAMQYSTVEGTQGICPNGWYIPTNADFQACSTMVGGDGNALKAIGQGMEGGAGTNTSGFSALIAGFRNSYSYFVNLGQDAFFWSSTEYLNPYHLTLYYGNSSIYLPYSAFKENGFSVRCLKGEGANTPPSIPTNPSSADNDTAVFTSVLLTWSCSDPDGDPIYYDVYFGTDNPPVTKVNSNSTAGGWHRRGLSENTTYYWQIIAKDDHSNSRTGPVWRFTTGGPFGLPCPGNPTVEYSGKTYNTVQIGSQCWLQENLDVGTMIDSLQNQTDNDTIEKYCYRNDPANCTIYGGLYQRSEASEYISMEKGICPPGWHIPTLVEFQTLSNTVGGDGNALKSIGQGSGDGEGINTSGFSALLAGEIGWDGYSYFNGLSQMAGFVSPGAGITYLVGYERYVGIEYRIPSEYGFSVRCLKD